MSLENLPGPIIFLIGMLIMIPVVPRQIIRELSSIGLIGGIGVGIALIYLMQNIFGFWLYPANSDLIHIAGLPVFLIISWFPVIILFAYLLGQYKNTGLLMLIVLTFPAVATLSHYIMLGIGTLFYNNWSLFSTFLISLGIHLGIALYLYATGRLEIMNKIEQN